jgi:hypothetical protein
MSDFSVMIDLPFVALNPGLTKTLILLEFISTGFWVILPRVIDMLLSAG